MAAVNPTTDVDGRANVPSRTEIKAPGACASVDGLFGLPLCVRGGEVSCGKGTPTGRWTCFPYLSFKKLQNFNRKTHKQMRKRKHTHPLLNEA